MGGRGWTETDKFLRRASTSAWVERQSGILDPPAVNFFLGLSAPVPRSTAARPSISCSIPESWSTYPGNQGIFIRGDVAVRHGHFFQDFPFFAQDPDFTPQAAQLLLLVTGQPVVPLAGIQIRLLEPEPQRFAGHAQILGNLPMGFPAGPGQPD